MSSFDPSSTQESLNPYAAPLADLGAVETERAGDDSEAEIVRRLYLGHEAAVKSVGSLHYFGAFLGAMGVMGVAVVMTYSVQRDPQLPTFAVLAVYGGMTVVNFGLGYGLRHLQSWARWTETAFLLLGVLSMVAVMIGLYFTGHGGLVVTYLFVLLIYFYVLYLLLSPKGTMVFSPGYSAIIEKTPHVKYKTSRIVRIAVAIFLGLIVLGVILGVIGTIFGDVKVKS
ncbi:hypothetical protein SAMN05444166_2387 [Singulisphaera sp. GP187]|uniref:hypothetical protein n=1 Tax=Singulisphaera sp. GP187 TaxID=1882752 RepID=UPI000925E329|nr:hypothetical protein [Singulisphaera sp. GP187]SIO08906.1 hypothetical protein SAMN05444166_2387 [Singulisphaera sp. GP187]